MRRRQREVVHLGTSRLLECQHVAQLEQRLEEAAFSGLQRACSRERAQE